MAIITGTPRNDVLVNGTIHHGDVDHTERTAETIVIDGKDGNDKLYGDDGNDMLYGGKGND